jgi:hypothetical protein
VTGARHRAGRADAAAGQPGNGDADASLGEEITIVAGSPDDTEIAAVIAVVSGAIEELAAEGELPSAGAVTAWQRSQRSIRVPLEPGRGRWRSFSA